MKSAFLQTTLEDLEKKDLRRRLRTVEGPQGPRIRIDGREYLNFCSNNYLGLADDPRLIEAAVESLKSEGFGSGASRLVCGNLSAHERLEEECARFKGTEDCLVFTSGYMANVGIISGLFERGDVIFSDRLNHASIIDGSQLSGAEFKRYPHADIHKLEEMLPEAAVAGFKKKVIITDSVFSMDGDIAPLDKIVELARRYDSLVMIDEAHAFGVLGEHGKGAAELFGLAKEIDIQMGTFSKAAGGFGAYCCGSKELIDVLVNKARSFVYTTAIPPSVAAASLRGLQIIEQEPERRRQLWDNTHFLLNGLKAAGFETLNTQTPIIPVVVKEARTAVEFSRRLLERGVFVSAIRPPTVPVHTARLRVTVMATHTRQDLQEALGQLQHIGKDLCLI